MKYVFSLLIAVVLKGAVFGQDPQFTQFYAAPMYLNPAFAGTSAAHRINLNSRAQWVGLPRTFVTYAASYDYNFDRYNSGVGFMAMVDKSGTGVLTSTMLSALYSYRIKLNSNWIVRPGLQFTYASRNLDFYKLTFGDQLDRSGASGIASAEQFDQTATVRYFDFNSGVLVHNSNVWFGVTARHLNQPDQSLVYGTKSVLPMYYSVHGGARIHLGTGGLKKSYGTQREKSITPTFIYKMQNGFNQLDVGSYIYLEPIVLGLWYRGVPITRRTYDAIAVLLGVKMEKFTFGYSYDLTVSRLGTTNTVGSHEISLSVFLGEQKKKTKKRRKDFVIPCPKL